MSLDTIDLFKGSSLREWVAVFAEVGQRSDPECAKYLYVAAKVNKEFGYSVHGISTIDFAYTAAVGGDGCPAGFGHADWLDLVSPPQPMEVPLRDRLGDVMIAAAYELHLTSTRQLTVRDWLRTAAVQDESLLGLRLKSVDLAPEEAWPTV